jgi:hypothetical protein
MTVGYEIYLHTNTDQPERHKCKMESIGKIYSYRIHDANGYNITVRQ